MPRNGSERGGGATPSAASAATPAGISPSPQALSIGGHWRSASRTDRPWERAAIAVASPTGPPPTTTTSIIAAPEDSGRSARSEQSERSERETGRDRGR